MSRSPGHSRPTGLTRALRVVLMLLTPLLLMLLLLLLLTPLPLLPPPLINIREHI